MKLTVYQRWVLANQLQILEYLSQDEYDKATFSKKRHALEEGYEMEFVPFANMCPENEVVTEEISYEVIRILDMFRAINNAVQSLNDTQGVNVENMRFKGFDANDEGKQYSFTKYFCLESSEKRYEESFPNKVMLNTHFPVLGLYRRMLQAWDTSKQKYCLTKQDLLRIQEAMPYQ